MRHIGVQGEPWSRCDRCGFEYPMGMLTRQKGRLVCTKTCFDDTDQEHRTRIISAVLASSDQEKVDQVSQIRMTIDTDEVTF